MHPAVSGILHELFHLKNKDTFWSIMICFLRCLHWCNPLINYCANLAINDMESRCDQFVLEQLEGEERRDYGLILLSMSNERFAKTSGSTCINNSCYCGIIKEDASELFSKSNTFNY